MFSTHSTVKAFGAQAFLILAVLLSPQVLQAQQSPRGEAASPLPDGVLPAGARIYVAPMADGFEHYVVAGLQQKKVPLVVTTIRDKADFELTGVSSSEQAHWFSILFRNQRGTNETASIKIVNLRSGEVVFAYATDKGNSERGKQSTGEGIAKHIKQKIERQ